ncbi:MAG: nucleoside monophosphate kinase [Candidatus Woesearchaeota archaeon]
MILLFLGPPGAGKGTYSDIIGERNGFTHVSSGDVCREAVANGGKIGEQVASYINKGQYVPDPIIIPLFEKKLKVLKNVILDNFPGNLTQAKAVQGRIPIQQVFYFYASMDVLMDRMSNRLTCKQCGAIFNIKNIPPKVEGKCDKCGGELYQRADQHLDVVKKRLETYEKEVLPLVDFYEAKKMLIRSESLPIEQVETVIKPIINYIQKHK